VSRARQIFLHVRCVGSVRARRRITGGGFVIRGFKRIDQLRAGVHVARIEQTLDGHLDEIAVREIAGTVSVGQPRGAGEKMPEPWSIQREFLQLEPVEEHEDLAGRGCTRGRRPHAADAITPEIMTDRRTFDDLVGGEVVKAEGARAGDAVCRRDDPFSQGAGVKGVCAVRGNHGERLGESWLLQDRSRRHWLAAWQEDCRDVSSIQARGISAQHICQTWAYREPVARQPGRGLEQISPGKLAVAFMERLHQTHKPRHADGTPRCHRYVKGQGFTVLHEHVGRGAGRRGFPCVPRGEPVRAMDECKATAANAAGLRLDHVEDQQRGNGSIRGRPADGHHPVPCLGRQGICRDDHAFFRRDEGLCSKA